MGHVPGQDLEVFAHRFEFVDHRNDLQSHEWRQHCEATGEMQILQEIYQREGKAVCQLYKLVGWPGG